jgi:hypothetical protein
LGPQRVHGVIQARDKFASDLTGFFIPTRFQWLSPKWATARSDHFSGGLTEHMAYLGIPLILFLGWTIVRGWRRPVVRAAGTVGLVMALLSMGVHLHIDGHRTTILLPWAVGAIVPVLNNVVASRLILGVFMMAGLLLAIGTDRLLERRDLLRRGMTAIVLALVLVPLFPKLPFPTAPLEKSTFFGSAEAARLIPDGAVVLELPVAYGARNGGAPTLWHEQAGDRFKRPGGYFLGPHAHDGSSDLVVAFYRVDALIEKGKPVPRPDTTTRNELLVLLRRTHIQFVVVGPSPTQAGLVAYVQSLLGAPQHVLDSYLWRLPA